MSNYSNNIMNSIDILTQSALRKLKYDITIKAIIKTIVDVKTGEYKVLYEGNLLSAFAKDDKTAYDINDTVYVKVPEGDFDNKLIIDYKLRGADLSASEVDELRNSMFEVSDNLLSSEKFSQGFQITTGKNNNEVFKCNPQNIIINDKEFAKNFTYYSNKYEYIKIKATFRTNFIKTFVKGNYGLKFNFFSDENDSEQNYSYCLDSTDFNGNPYALMNESEQEIFIQIPTSKFNGKIEVLLYQNMENDYTKSLPPNIKDDSSFINYDNEKYNIFVKDIKLFFMEKVDLFNLPYYFRVKALQGNDCSRRNLYFIPQLLSNGAEVSSNSTITWYEQDLTVDVASDNYDRAAGVGWKKIQKTVADPNSEAEPCIYNNSLYVPQKSIPQIKRFKVIATYDKSTFDKTIEVINSSVANPYSLVYENDKLKVQNVVGKTITWYYAVGTSTFAKIDNSTDTLPLDNYAKYINVKFYCVVKEDEPIYDDTILEYDYTNEIVEEITVTYDGTSMFKYDASGKIDDTIYSSEYALTAKVAFQNGLSDKQYEIKWYDPDGNELITTDQKREIKNSMVTQVRLDKKNSIRYNISSYYKQDSNNTFKIKIITADKEYSFEKEIIFIKDGDQGTNGSACALVIKPVDGEKDYLYHNTGDSNKNRGINLKVFLYNAKDNTSPNITKELIKENITGYNVECTLNDEANGEKVIHVDYVKGSGNDVKDYCYIKITYSVNNGPDIILCYPIDVVINNTKDKKPILDIAKYIKYDALGMNPVCRREILGYNNETITVTGVDTATKTLVVDKKGYLSPNSHFPFDKTEGFVALKYDDDDNDNVIHTIYFYKNSYGNTAINNWDGQKVHISGENEKEQYILAPLIGAGTKSNSNFTGVVMGYDSSQGMGLYGYKDGISSFGFKTDGTGYIGAEASGRISFNGKNAVIYGGLNKNGANSMTLNLYNYTSDTEKINKNTLAIDIKGDSGTTFSVDYSGNLFASKADIEGKITATSGKIGNWLIDNNGLKHEESGTQLTSEGELIVKKGTIGPWTLTQDGLFYKSKNQTEYTTQLTKDQITISSIRIHDSSTNTQYCFLGVDTDNNMALQGYSKNLSINSGQWTLLFKGTELQCDIPAANQYGIYARFAD